MDLNKELVSRLASALLKLELRSCPARAQTTEPRSFYNLAS